MRVTDKNNKKTGTTLIEIMMAMLILAILAVSASMLLHHPRLQAVTAAHRQSAVHAANSAMDAAVSMGYQSVSNAVGSYALANVADRYSNRIALSGKRSVELVTFSGTDFKRLIIRVDYLNGDRPVVVESLLAP